MKQPMSDDKIHKGIKDLNDMISDYDSYDKFFTEIQTSYLFQQIQSDNMYYKILAIRLFMERFEKLRSCLRKKHPEVTKFLNETNHIENDYVFQLNPEKFFSIPKMYVEEIDNFLDSHKNNFEDLNNEISW